jgi:hypothetical protein
MSVLDEPINPFEVEILKLHWMNQAAKTRADGNVE